MLNMILNEGPSPRPADDTLTLPFELRQKGRLRAVSDGGVELGLFLERGRVLLAGDKLVSECGRVVEVRAGAEPVITAHAADWPSFARACYHLGNRHVTLEIGERWLRFAPDHVLEHLAEHLGLCLEREQAPF
ncbi:urease accessory protein UreE [Oceanimonas sp. NS1]|nr:urease accessory protein UreE [Oceanimonas sp. NS1]